jgi:hypothetical protein
VANFVTNRGKAMLANYDLPASTWRAMLLTTSFTSDDALNLVDDGTTSDPLSYEIGVSGYVRKSFGLTTFEDDTNDFAGLDTADITWTALGAGATIGWMAIYRYSTSGSPNTTSDTGQEFFGAYSVTATPTNGGDITIQIGSTTAGGAIKVGSTS